MLMLQEIDFGKKSTVVLLLGEDEHTLLFRYDATYGFDHDVLGGTAAMHHRCMYDFPQEEGPHPATI